MQNKKKLVIEILFLVLIAGITLYSIFYGKDAKEILRYTREAETIYIALSIGCVVLFILGEASILHYMLKSFNKRVTLRRCYLYSCIGFFFSCITPSATGGQPAQIYYMKKDKIPIPVATVILMIITITYKLVLIVLGGTVLILRPESIMQYLEPVLTWCYLGIALNVVCVAAMCLLLFHPLLAERLLFALFDILEHMHLLRKKQERRQRLQHFVQVYKDTAAYLGNHKKIVWNVFLITILQRCVLFMVTPLTYLSFGFREASLSGLLLLQMMISVSVDMLPLPGGVGISEGLFLTIFCPFFGKAFTIPAMLVSRGVSYYGQLLVSAVLTGYANFKIGCRKKVKRN